MSLEAKALDEGVDGGRRHFLLVATTVTGLAGAMGGVMGILSQTTIGWTVQNLSFTPVFAVCAFLHLTAFALVSLLAGKIGQNPPTAATA